MLKNKVFLIAVLIFISLKVSTQDTIQQPSFKFLYGFMLELGGDDVAEIYFTNGESQKVKAGQGGSLAFGVQYQIPNFEQLLIRGTVGFKYVTTQADNAHIRLSRVPFNLSAHYMISKDFLIGAGLVYHDFINFKADGIGPDQSFDPALGPKFEFSYKGIGLSYTIMNYISEFDEKFSASAIGLSYYGTFPNR
jgi:hypothetical protein